ERVGDRNGRPLVDGTNHEMRCAQFTEPLGEHGVADSRDRSTQLGEGRRALHEGAENDAIPPLAEKTEGQRQCFVAHRRLARLGRDSHYRFSGHAPSLPVLVSKVVLAKYEQPLERKRMTAVLETTPVNLPPLVDAPRQLDAISLDTLFIKAATANRFA